MRSIKYIVVHCTATPQTTTIASIQNYWRNNLKWKSSGYQIIITPDGKINRLAPDESVCNGVAGYNSVSLHVSYIGGVNGPKAIDNRTDAQKAALVEVLTKWKELYPDAIIQGHRDFLKKGVNWKDCPSFDAKSEYKLI
jgi:N-acetylmuramoyl-L-alanine amidase